MGDKDRLNLFAEFPGVSTEEWEKKISDDLKGNDYEKKLIWKTIEGFNVKPYYRAENLSDISYINSLPNEYPYQRSYKSENNNWCIRQDIAEENIEEANKIAVDAISKGADSVMLRINKVRSDADFAALLKDIDLTKTQVHFSSASSYPAVFDMLEKYIKSNNIDPQQLIGSFNFDPISYLLLNGNFYTTQDNNFVEAGYILKKTKKLSPSFKAITINGHYLHNSGASATEELAFSLASANEYLTQLTSKDFSVDEVASRLMFSIGTGSNYFIEIAKIRALRILWAKIVEQYQPEHESSLKTSIHCITSTYNKTIYDAHNNVLRSTTETMSAAIGGADSISVNPYDIFFHKPDLFSYRIARNIQLTLKNEAYLDKIIDPAGGSYYIENLTDLIAESAWKLFREIEAKGGYIEAIKVNLVQTRVEETHKKRMNLINNRKFTILGTNQYPDQNENMMDKIDRVFYSKNSAQYQVQNSKYKKLVPKREAEAFERLRLASEEYVSNGNDKPKVFLLTIGNLTMRRARAGFTTNFFGCIGYDIKDNIGFNTAEEGINAAIKADAAIVVICSSDDEYATLAPEIVSKIKAHNPETKVFIAGNPKNAIDDLKKAGIDDFININTNAYEFLSSLQREFNII